MLSDGGFDLPKEGLHILYRRLGQKFAVVFANVFSEEVKALFNVRDPCFVL